MEDHRSSYEYQDVTEASSQISGGQRQLFQDQLPADSVEAQDHHSKAEPGDIAGGHERISAAEFETGRSQTLHEHGDDRQKNNITSFAEKFI